MSGPQAVSGLMDQIHELKTQLADAEQRGAVKLLDYLMRQHADSMAIIQLDLAGLWDRLVTGEAILP